MSIQVSANQVKSLVKSIRTSLAGGQLPKLAGNLEQAAQALGFPTWDALSAKGAGAANVEALPAGLINLPATSKAFALFQMHPQEGSKGRNPGWVQIQMDAALLRRINELQESVVRAGLMYAKCGYDTCVLRGEKHVTVTHLVVGKDYFWMEGSFGPSGNGFFETHAGSLKDLTLRLSHWEDKALDFPLYVSTQFTGPGLAYMVQRLIEVGRLPAEAFEHHCG